MGRGENLRQKKVDRKNHSQFCFFFAGGMINICVYLSDIQPSPDVLEHCAAFLVNVKDWSYLINLDNTNSGHIEVRFQLDQSKNSFTP